MDISETPVRWIQCLETGSNVPRWRSYKTVDQNGDSDRSRARLLSDVVYFASTAITSSLEFHIKKKHSENPCRQQSIATGCTNDYLDSKNYRFFNSHCVLYFKLVRPAGLHVGTTRDQYELRMIINPHSMNQRS